MEVAPIGTLPSALRDGQEIWESLLLPTRQQSLPLPAKQQSLTLLGKQAGGVSRCIRKWCVCLCVCVGQQSTSEGNGAFAVGSHECLATWVIGVLGNHHPPALSPPERVPSNPHPSGTVPAADKSFRLLTVCWVSAGPMECACPQQVTGLSASQRAPSLPGVQPH